LKSLKPFAIEGGAPSPRGEGWGEAISWNSNAYYNLSDNSDILYH